MTLATIPRYDGQQTSEVGEHAVVLGASIAGLCSARVLADAFEAVTVVERDPLPEDPATRRGVPQANHVHVLLEAGRATLEDLFPGFGEQLLSAGGVLIDASRDMNFYAEGGFLAGSRQRLPAYSATRPLIEFVIRDRLGDFEGVEIRENCRFVEYRTDDDAATVTGVEIERTGGQRDVLDADLVVDATGRTSRTPEWLEAHGYPAPAVDEVTIDVAYSTTLVERPASDRRGYVIFPSENQYRTGAVVPVEGERWLMTLVGIHDESPPTDPGRYEQYAASLPIPHLREILDEYSRTTDETAYYPFPTNQRRYFENCSRFPGNLVVVGDAIASFNPLYAQGMSVAALEAVQLHHSLASGALENVGPRFFARVSDVVDDAWTLAVGSDHQFRETTGPKPRGTDLANRYLARLIHKAQHDADVFDAFMRVQGMERSPGSLFRPGVLWRVLKPTV